MLKTMAMAVLSMTVFVTPVLAETVVPMHGIALHGAPKYATGFEYFDYVNPQAPKGGDMRLAGAGTFDSLNPYVLRGVSAPGLSLVYQTLMQGAFDEPFSQYGLLAESVETPEDRSWVAFTLRDNARFHDGKPVTADDVVWTFETLISKGHPFYRAYYGHVKSAVAEGPRRVKFTFDMAGNRELPLIMGQMPVLPKHYWADKDFERSTTDLPMGSGPYKVSSVKHGQRIVYTRVKDWWAKDLPVMKGMYNFDNISYDMFRDETVLLQALFAGNYDLRQENIAKAWEVSYDRPPVKEGLIKKEEIPHGLPVGMQGFVMNARRAIFADPRVREAMGLTFDFEWSNKQFAYGRYKRTKSYFENSELAAQGLPTGRELEILEQYRGRVPDEVFTTVFTVPETSGSGHDLRPNLIRAKDLLTQAGWKMGKSGLLEKDGHAFRLEFLIHSPTFQRWIDPMINNLKKLGVEVTLRLVDTTQYQKRMENFDYDMTITVIPQSLSPGNEQRDFFTSAKADIPGSRNIMGIKNEVVDALVDQVVAAPDREELVARTRALDRVLLWQYYVIPNWYIDYYRVAYWDKFGHPAVAPPYDLGEVETWWYDAEKAARLARRLQSQAQ